MIAMNMRAAFATALATTAEPETREETDADVARKHWDGMARARRYGDLLRETLGG